MTRRPIAPLLVAALLAGCGAPATPDTPRPAVVPDAPPIESAAPAGTPRVAEAPSAPAENVAPTADVEPASLPTLDPDRDFTPTDAEGVELAAGRPKLIEFFAFW